MTERHPARPGYRLALNISLVFTELPLLERFGAAAQRGFTGVELQFPYDVAADDLAGAARAANIDVALINVPVGDLMHGGAGLAAHPGRRADYARALDQCETYVRALRPDCVNVLAGRVPAGVDRAASLEVFRTNLVRTRDRLAPLGVTTVFEAINTFDLPDFLIDSSALQCELLESIGSEDLRLQFDVYHMTRMNEDVTGFLRRHGAQTGHIQFADVPGRGEPGTGAIDFNGVFGAIRAGAYTGWVAAEYVPARASAASFDWLTRAPFRDAQGLHAR